MFYGLISDLLLESGLIYNSRVSALVKNEYYLGTSESCGLNLRARGVAMIWSRSSSFKMGNATAVSVDECLLMSLWRALLC